MGTKHGEKGVFTQNMSDEVETSGAKKGLH